jgi:predicted transcriptional regulator
MTAIEQVFQHIKVNPGLLPSEIAAALPEVNSCTTYRAIDNLWVHGEIERLAAGDGFRYFIDTTNGSDPVLAELQKQARQRGCAAVPPRFGLRHLTRLSQSMIANDTASVGCAVWQE